MIGARMPLLVLALSAVILLFSAVLPRAAHAQEPDAAPSELCPDVTDVPLLDVEPMTALVNARRRAADLTELEPRESLSRAARLKAADSAGSSELIHEIGGRTATERARDCGYPPTYYTSENLAAAGGGDDDAALLDLAFRQLLSSPPHRGQLEHPDVRWLGVAVVRNTDGFLVWVLVFGGETVVTPPDEW